MQVKKYFEKKVSLLSTSDVRYDGELYTVDPSEQSIALKHVNCMGTEGRRTGDQAIAPSDCTYEFIIFRAVNIRELWLDEGNARRDLTDEILIPLRSGQSGTTYPKQRPDMYDAVDAPKRKVGYQQGNTMRKPPTKKTFYRRQLPSPPAIAFASKEGRDLFRESLNDGYMEGYFVLAEQFRTQDEPAFCGLSTLTMVLNTLAVDPKRVWKGPWRWYSESMLDCCRSLDEIKTTGIEFDQFACLGRCNSLNMLAKRPNQRHIYPSKQTKHPIIEAQNDDDKSAEPELESEDVMMVNPLKRKYFSLDEFREDVMLSCLCSNDPVVIVSYSRKGLKQTGDGHFSPIAAYHKGKDMVLVMDVARFKYPPHWVDIKVLYDAMCRIDKSCNKTRGWIVTSCTKVEKPYFFTFNTNEINTQNALDLNENICCCSKRFMHELDGQNSTNVSCQCSQDEPLTAIKVIKCLLNCLPLPLDKYIANQTEKFGIILEESHEIIKTKLMNGIRDTGIYAVVTHIFNDESNKALIRKFENCLNNKIEIITLMMLVIGNSAWGKISNEKVSNDLIHLTAVDQAIYPELSHEIIALKHQIKHLRQFLLSTFSRTIEKDISKNCCRD